MEGGTVGHMLKGDHPRTIPAKFALIWFSGFRGEDLNVIFYQNMSNLYNQYKSVERKISQKNLNRNYSAILAILQITSYVHSRNSS